MILLLPVAAASGWWVARRGNDKREPKPLQDCSPAYFKGLNYLLNEQPDKAIDVFIKMLEVDSDTVETHMALGNLFRRRGEVERAIRIHQNLIARPSLDREQRAQALLELGQDYMRAGLFDRAENLFVELAETKLYSNQALTNLLEIYQQEKDWQRCLEIAAQLGKHKDPGLRMQMAHFYCELAQYEMKSHNIAVAEEYIRKAQLADRNCVRASILQGDMLRDRRDYQGAIKIYQHIEDQDAAYLPEIIGGLKDCFLSSGRRRELLEYLHALYQRHPGSNVMLVLTDLMLEDEGEERTVDFVLKHLSGNPDLKVLGRLINLNLQREVLHPRETLQVLETAVRQLLSTQPAYQCEHCGFGLKRLHWRCPSCKSWSSIKPLEGPAHQFD
ncbi:MAG: lipopolysaccharide assembly protein LapB [Chromatiales bacterium]